MPMIVNVSAHYNTKAATVGLDFQMDSIYTDDNLSSDVLQLFNGHQMAPPSQVAS